MKVVVDSGSTKADWIIFDPKEDKVLSITSLGLNPEVITFDELKRRVVTIPDLSYYQTKVTAVYFYGAGCGSKKMQVLVADFFKAFFENCQEIIVKEDTFAAVYATVSKGEKGVVCINGTGSNMSYFDGSVIHQRFDSLGFMAMDDCSGSAFGREILKGYFLQQMPKDLRESFYSKYELDADIVKYNLYKKENPNAYLASFLPFLIAHKATPYFQAMIKEQVEIFYKMYLQLYPEYKDTQVHFIGSVAYFLQDEFKEMLHKLGVRTGRFVQKPLDGLLAYHKEE